MIQMLESHWNSYEKEKSCIDKCLKSIFSNTYKNFEVIIVNDGSTDKTEDIINKYIKTVGIKSKNYVSCFLFFEVTKSWKYMTICYNKSKMNSSNMK